MKICYKVGDSLHDNKLLALYQSMLTGIFPEFHYHTSVFESINWSTPVVESFDMLCDLRAHQLRNQYDHLVLAYSGGTDSQTIWETFKRNNIHIDDIVVSFYSKGSNTVKNSMPVDAASWIKENHYDTTTNIIVVDRNDESHKSFFSSENWIIDNPVNSFSRYEATMDKESFWLEIEKKYNNKNYCVIAGYEKPCIRLENNKWYGYFLDAANYNLLMGISHIEPFFSTDFMPELHVKQSQMLRDFVQHKFKTLNQKPNFWDSRFDAAQQYPLLSYCESYKSCGRVDEIFKNLGVIQKSTAKSYWALSPMQDKIEMIGDVDVVGLREDLLQKKKYALNYVKGIYNIVGDHTFYKWLLENNWCKKHDNPLKLTGIFSKFFYLGEYRD